MTELPAALGGLASFKQFLVYKIRPSKIRPGKTDKLPVDHLAGKPLMNWNNKVAWIDAETAIKSAQQFGKKFGVGFVFTEEDPFFFLDIDNCINEKQLSETALQLYSLFFGAACEVSSSLTGLHIIGRYNQLFKEHTCKNTEHDIELYTNNHFVALTGNSIQGSVNYDCTQQLNNLIDNYFSKSTTVKFNWTNEAVLDWNGPFDDQELINRALQSHSAKSAFGFGASFKDLWENNTEVLSRVYNNDASSYDAALAQHLAFWTGNNCERIHKLMLQSKLTREKWNRPDYLPRTILSACAKQTTWLHDKHSITIDINTVANECTLSTGDTLLSAEQQLQYFKGCVYICDLHQILTPGGKILRPEQFRAKYGGYSFVADNVNSRVIRNAWEAFIESQVFRAPKTDSSCFRPDLTPGKIIHEHGKSLVNIYWPAEIVRKKGNAAPFLNHLEKILPDKKDQLILLCYMAACVQYKGKKFQWAPILQGVEGNGKTLFTRCVAYAVGMQYTHFPRAFELTAKFNDWMYGKLFIGVEDVFVPDSQREILEALKPMITSLHLEIEAKGITKRTLNICCNFILNTNYKEGLRKSQNDRRFAHFFTAQQTPEDLIQDGMGGNYFSDLYDWLNADGYAIVAEFLYTFDIPDDLNPAVHCQRAPLTTSTQDAITYGQGAIEQEILEAIQQDVIGFKNGWISSIQLDRLLERTGLDKRISRIKRCELLKTLGYDRHPFLKDGRVNNSVLPDGGKPRLYVKHDHEAKNLTNSAEIAKAYTDAQL